MAEMNAKPVKSGQNDLMGFSGSATRRYSDLDTDIEALRDNHRFVAHHDTAEMFNDRPWCSTCFGTGIGGYLDHGAAQYGPEAMEALRCKDCDGSGLDDDGFNPYGSGPEPIGRRVGQ